MPPCAFPFEHCYVHYDWLQPTHWLVRLLVWIGLLPELGVARLFQAPIGRVDADTRQPWSGFCWTCNVRLARGRMIVISAALVPPPPQHLEALLLSCEQLGNSHIGWERWKRGRKRMKKFRLMKGLLLDE